MYADFTLGAIVVVVYSAFCLIMVVISSLMDNYILGGIAFAETDAVKICKTYSPMISIHSLITEADGTSAQANRNYFISIHSLITEADVGK